jgi:thermolysin
MKKLGILFSFMILAAAALPAAAVGSSFLHWDNGPQAYKMSPRQSLAEWQAFFAAEIKKGNLIPGNVQADAGPGMVHRRFNQLYKGIPVFGGQIIWHEKNGVLAGISGEYYQIQAVDTQPRLDNLEAEKRYRQTLPRQDALELTEPSVLCIYPVSDDEFRLAFRIRVRQGMGFSRTGLVDAVDGTVLLSFSNIKTEQAVIGIGTGFHGDQLKLVLTQDSDGYWMATEDTSLRPVKQYTVDYHHSLNDSLAGIPSSANGVFGKDTDVNVHAYLGWVYDYYYARHGRHGMDGANLTIFAYTHVFGDGMTDNAFWSSDMKAMVFLDPLYTDWQTGAGLDVIGHEFTHGVTTYTSGLVYHSQSGALDESFSDIMGTAIEFNFQPAGNGFNKADWVIGEDIYPGYSASNYLRNLANPNALSDPCHLSQYYNLPDTEAGDWGGVHTNCTIFGHAFYLLANGGTNAVSHLSVTSIGIGKAAQIYYRAWTFYLTPTASFLSAANALLQSAKDLYGSNGSEYGQVLQSLLAIGFTA